MTSSLEMKGECESTPIAKLSGLSCIVLQLLFRGLVLTATARPWSVSEKARKKLLLHDMHGGKATSASEIEASMRRCSAAFAGPCAQALGTEEGEDVDAAYIQQVNKCVYIYLYIYIWYPPPMYPRLSSQSRLWEGMGS